MCDNIRNFVGLFGFKFFLNFGTLSVVDQTKVEETMLAMMAKFNTTPIEICNTIPDDLYNKIDAKWKQTIKTERQIEKENLEI